jgi:hypothetical protein
MFIMHVDKPCSIVVRSFSLITDAAIKMAAFPNLLDPPPRLRKTICTIKNKALLHVSDREQEFYPLSSSDILYYLMNKEIGT